MRAGLKLSLLYPLKGFVLFLFNCTIVYLSKLLISIIKGVKVEGETANLVGLVI